MEHFLAGLWLALGACVGMVLWQFVAWTLNNVKVIALAVLARIGIIQPVKTFTNGRGERVFDNDPKGGPK